MISTYYSQELKSWVRMTKECDGEYCHTSGYSTREEALGIEKSFEFDWIHPCDIKNNSVRIEEEDFYNIRGPMQG
jgi:hypothetical protein